MKPRYLGILAAGGTLVCTLVIVSCATGGKTGYRGLSAAEDVVDRQKARMFAGQSIFDNDHRRISRVHGGRLPISKDPAVAGFWQMPEMPKDEIVMPNGRKAHMKMGAIQATVLPSGKVLMVSGSSNRGDQRSPTESRGVPVTSQVYNFIDNTLLFNPALVDSTEVEPKVAPDQLQSFAFPLEAPRRPASDKGFLGTKALWRNTIGRLKKAGVPPPPPAPPPVEGEESAFEDESVDAPPPVAPAQARPGKPTLYERPHSLPDHLANAVRRDAPLDADFGTVRDPKFCAIERPADAKLFNNGIAIFRENGSILTPARYCEKVADADLKGGREIAPGIVDVRGGPTAPNIDLFCGGHHPLPDGNVLFAGGTRKAVSFPTVDGKVDFGTPIPFHGIKRTLSFDWKAQRWTEANGGMRPVNMGDGRWYPTLVELPDGKLFIIGGMNHRGEVSHTLEVYDPHTGTMSHLVDFRPIGAPPCSELLARKPATPLEAKEQLQIKNGYALNKCIMENEPFTVFDWVAKRRFDNYPRVVLTHNEPTGITCADPTRRSCVRLLITGDGSAEGNRDLNMMRTLYADVDTTAFPHVRVKFVRGPRRLGPTHLYPTTLFDPSNNRGDYLILGGSLGAYDPTQMAEEADGSGTNFNSRRDFQKGDVKATVAWMHRFNTTAIDNPRRGEIDPETMKPELGTRQAGTFDLLVQDFLGTNADVTARVGTSRAPGAVRGRINQSGMVNPNAVILPTRQFLVMGGGNHSYSDPLFHPVLYTPSNDPFVRAPANQVVEGMQTSSVALPGPRGWIRSFMNPIHLPRLYHNTALLLPDGRVFMGGGNTFISFLKGVESGTGLPLVGAEGQKNNYNAFPMPTRPGERHNPVFPELFIDSPAEQYQVELFSPPYLFIPGDRPVIQSLQLPGCPKKDFSADLKNNANPNLKWINPASEDLVQLGSAMTLTLSGVKPGTQGRVTFVRLGGVTHAYNFSQKLHTLLDANNPRNDAVTVGPAGTVSVLAPQNPKAATPGYYMMFFVNNVGKPSEARMIRLLPPGAGPPRCQTT